MKNKGKLFLYIAMICLCICSMAFGIYSAKKAQLNVSGSIGFIAHDLNVTWSGTISNAIDKSNNVYTAGDITEETSIDKTWTLGDLYFNDIDNYIQYANGKTFPKSIVVTIKLYNYSAFPIKAICSMADQAEIESKGVTVDFENNPLIPQAVEQDITPSIGEVKIKFTLRQDNEIDASKGVELASFGTITIDVSQTINQTTEIKYGEIKSVYGGNIASYNAFYVEMGKYISDYSYSGEVIYSSGEPIKCVIYKIVDNGEEVTLNSYDDVNNYVVNLGNGRYEAKSGAEYYCFLDCYFPLEYCNNYHFDSKLTTIDYTLAKNEFNQPWYDYSTSNLRFYLDGCTVKKLYNTGAYDANDIYDEYGNTVYNPAGQNKNFYDDYKLTNDLLFNKVNEKIISDFAGTYYTTINQKFWAFSLSDYEQIVSLGTKSVYDDNSNIVRTYYGDNAVLTYNIGTTTKESREDIPAVHGLGPVVGFAFEG